MENTYAYTAGLVDGEGSIMLLNRGTNRARGPWVSVGLTDYEPLEFLREQVGGFISKPKTRNEPRKDIRIWSIGDNAADALLKQLRPLLVIERRRSLAEAVIERYPTARHGRETPESARKRRAEAEELFQWMRKRNDERLTALPELEPSDPREADFAYLAGILDGEGWINAASRGSLAEVHSTDPELPAFLMSKFGGRVHRMPENPNQNRRAIWSWRIGKKEGLPVLIEASRFMLLERKLAVIRDKASVAGQPLTHYLPGTALEVAARSGKPYRYVDKQLRAAASSGSLSREKVPGPRGRPGRPSWRYRKS